MALIVQKYGGTSVGSIERMRNVAERVKRAVDAGNRVIVVVSAMSGETDRLLALGSSLSKRPAEREMDVLVASGEQVSAALVSIALNDLGIRTRSMLGHQARIVTDSAHRKARIRTIDGEAMKEALHENPVIVVAGFQGVDNHGNITTLGRGGSDTSAVAIAAAVSADLCEIYTDVTGVFTADPNLCPDARKLAQISYEEMLELASLGAKVLQIRSVELGMRYNIPIHVRSSFSDEEGTIVTSEERLLESVVVSGVTADKKTVKLTIRDVPDKPGIVASVFEPLAEANISVDMIMQTEEADGTTDITFTVAQDDADRAEEVTRDISPKVGGKSVERDDAIAKVSIVGVGMRSHAGIAAKMFRLLANHGINIEAISTSEIKTSCLVEKSKGDDAVRALHAGFNVGSKDS